MRVTHKHHRQQKNEKPTRVDGGLRYVDFENKVINGDCLDELRNLPSAHYKAVITDPPYFIGFNSSAKDGGRQDYGNATMLNPLFDALFTEIKRVLRPDGVMLMFTDWRTYP